ncbi:hypothetical protein KIN20_029100 [Parelaphostrongylus tenuis]|uniref:Uncharacterized protein n=1 Tax=Parelaphostrongylus tenuis TaxID=148309 RepID=A0AAD5WFL3_PARTN|nr:hypothetical protein KIN20_029100 [Parelaphostrongylus tenuis]
MKPITALCALCVPVAAASYNSAPSRYDSYHRPNTRNYYDCPYYDDYYDDSYTESKRCSRCLKLGIFPSEMHANIRHNARSNECLQAIIACIKTGELFFYSSVEKSGMILILAVGSGGSVVAQCRSDKKWHVSSSVNGTEVTASEIDCVSSGRRLQDVNEGINERPKDTAENREVSFAHMRFRSSNKI